jgi:hypothetical protein
MIWNPLCVSFRIIDQEFLKPGVRLLCDAVNVGPSDDLACCIVASRGVPESCALRNANLDQIFWRNEIGAPRRVLFPSFDVRSECD